MSAGAAPADAARQLRAARLALAYNALLTLAKAAAGWAGGSLAVLSEAANSAIDLAASGVTFAAVRFAARPPDRTHPFGHGKAHALAALVEGVLVLGTAAAVAVGAVRALLAGRVPLATGPGLAVMAATAVGNLAVSRYLARVGRETGSPALEAAAVHLWTDVASSLGVLVALALVRWTGAGALDAFAALLVAGAIVAGGLRVLREAVASLLDASLPEEEQRAVVAAVALYRDRVVELHDLRTRRVGPQRQVDFHLVVHRRLPFAEVHRLCDAIEEEVRRRLPGTHVLIHPEPCGPDCPRCREGWA